MAHHAASLELWSSSTRKRTTATSGTPSSNGLVASAGAADMSARASGASMPMRHMSALGPIGHMFAPVWPAGIFQYNFAEARQLFAADSLPLCCLQTPFLQLRHR